MNEPCHRRFQFGIRHLLLTTAAVAVVVGVCAPLMKDWNADQWWTLLPIGIGLGLGVVIIMPVHMTAINHAQKALGRRRWLVRQTRGWNSTVTSAFTAGALIGLIVAPIGLVVLITLDQHHSPVWLGSFWLILLPAIPLFLWTQALLQTSLLSVGDHGIAIGFGFTAWKDIQCSYAPGSERVPLVVKLGRYVFQLHPAPEEERELAEYLLARCRPWDGRDRPMG